MNAPTGHATDQTALPGVGDEASFRRWLTVIFAVAVAARVALLVFAESRPAMFDFPDSHRYVQVARNIAAGLGPVDAPDLRSGTDPLFPLVLSAAPLAGFNETAAILRFGRAVNAALGAMSVLLLAGTARRLIDDRAAIFAAAILAIDPILLFFNALVLTEAMYVFFLLAAFYAAARMIEANRTAAQPARRQSDVATNRRGTSPIAWALMAGVCLGLGTLSRSTGLLLPIAFAPLAALAARSTAARYRTLPLIAVILLAAFFTHSPLLIRNYGLYGRFVPARIGGGASLLEALGPWADGAPGMDRIIYPRFPDGVDELERDRICRSAAMDWAKAHPREALALAWAKLKRTWSIVIQAVDYQSPLIKLVCRLTVAPIFAMAMVGAWICRKRPFILLLLLAPAVYFTLIHMVFVGSVRYRVPAMPMLFILAAAALAAIVRRRQTFSAK